MHASRGAFRTCRAEPKTEKVRSFIFKGTLIENVDFSLASFYKQIFQARPSFGSV